MTWDADRPISELPRAIREIFKLEARFLRQELSEMRLEVCLILAPEPKYSGHMIRTASSSNPDWYSELYHNYPGKLDRQCTLNALDRIIKLEDRPYKKRNTIYDTFYRDVIFNRLTQGHFVGNEPCPPRLEVCEFFNIEPNPNMFPESHPYWKKYYEEEDSLDYLVLEQ